jgi:hypothetical protein
MSERPLEVSHGGHEMKTTQSKSASKLPYALLISLGLILGAQAQAATLNQHFFCNDSDHFGALSTEVQQNGSSYLVSFSGFSATGIAKSLGLIPVNSPTNVGKIQMLMGASICSVSKTRNSVIACGLPQTWPVPTQKIDVLDRKGKVIASGTLASMELSINYSRSISVSGGTDFETDFNDMNFYAISEIDNSKRFEQRVEYVNKECAQK